MADPVKTQAELDAEAAAAKAAAAGPTPSFDAEKFRGEIMADVQQFMATQDKDVELDAAVRRGQPVATENPLAGVLEPIVGPRLREASLNAEAARDTSLFYSTHPEAIEYKDDLEKAFNVMLKNGTPITHEATWDWYRGRNQDKFFAKRQEAEKKKLAAAEAAGTLEPGARPVAGTTKSAHEATNEELAAGLKDILF